MAKKKKVRKPATLSKGSYGIYFRQWLPEDDDYPIGIRFGESRSDISLEAAKRIHKWLGRAIEYLESK